MTFTSPHQLNPPFDKLEKMLSKVKTITCFPIFLDENFLNNSHLRFSITGCPSL